MSASRHHQANVVLRDGSTVHVRPVRAEDAPAVHAFFERLSPKSITLRFFCGFPDLDRAVRWATDVDGQHRYGLIATSSADGRVVAHAGWEREPDHPERAEVAFAIADAMQHNGLGTILLGQLIEAADQAGVAVLSAEVLPQNHRMLHVFRDSGFPVTTRTLPGVVPVELATSRSPAAWSASKSLSQATVNDVPDLPVHAAGRA
jgi:L-amino acid N-acyltransferase YncA